MTPKYRQRLRQRRRRARVRGTAHRPRLSVFRSARHIYAQLIDDDAGRTVAAWSDAQLAPESGGGPGVARAGRVGRRLAELARQRGVSAAVFDRGRYRYAGRVKALAEGARAGGLKF